VLFRSIRESHSKDFPKGKEIITSELDQRTTYPLISDVKGNEVVFEKIRAITGLEMEQKRAAITQKKMRNRGGKHAGNA
jgi:hypothetical protein